MANGNSGGSSASRMLRYARQKPLHPTASVVASIGTLLALSGVPSRLGLSPDEVAAGLTAIFAIGATLLTWWESRRLP